MTTLEHGHDTRDRILDAARRLFAERGYAATSLADIASEVGLTKTAVAYHFHPKDRLATELIAPAAEDVIALFEGDFDSERAFVEALVTFVVRHRAIIRLIMEDISGADNAPPGSPGEIIRAFRDEIYHRLAGPDPDPARRVRAWALLGSLQYAVVKTIDLPQEDVRRTLLTTALASI
ncbi:TetR/AcrR family transcriptional regulator [Streptosporangium sp. NBC_01755]|uniref:TetR/AcrR family transcriptional regulator n=1 Tax=unclassified Streptosporangium TaxID=2632669 RepID=UPI002DDAB877|nr:MULTISPECIES: TetR family transcriptional regulator [unclassified Streptosporangium]WSA23567.1 TetR/AcrR family transcriptional regulator [Streptosporangium sp. NBC_01810]WSC98223.1 TetR/AcrR family transcriptional regulator [Streptosporangium sp. NBC_01755]